MKRPYGPLLIAFVSLLAGAPGPAVARDASLAKAKYLDPKLPIDKRVADLLARMTLEEKIAQLNGYWFPKSGVLVDDQLRPALGNEKARGAARQRPGRDLAPVGERGPQEEPRPARRWRS